jgi:nitrate/nitrite transporter NarK
MNGAITADARSKSDHTAYGLYLTVLLPFATGYFLSYLFRTINALIAEPLTNELGLSPTELGLLTATYFLLMGAIQLPVGVLLDRCGPRRVQCACLLVGSVGAIVFAFGNELSTLMLGRALIGIGFGTAFMAGLKAIVLWFPPERVPFANGLLVTLGALGAVTATALAQVLIDLVGWRGLFLMVAWLTAVSAIFIFFVVPQKARSPISQGAVMTLGTIFSDRRFWKLAPMSATCIGTAWALQGLWASPWLSVVERYDRTNVVQALFVMALSLSIAGLCLGFLAERLRSKGISTETLFAGVVAVFMFAQLCLLIRVSFIPPIVLLSLIGAIGAATVLAYTILPTYFSKEASGRANAALNILHVGVAFSVQWLIGVAIDLWPSVNGRHPVEAYQFAFGANLIVQSIAFIWFLVPSTETRSSARQKRIRIPNVLDAYAVPKPHCLYRAARHDWHSRTQDAQAQAHAWRAAALMSMTLCVVLLTLVSPSLPFEFTATHDDLRGGRTIWSNTAAVVVHVTGPLPATINSLPAQTLARETSTGGSDGRPISK